MHITIFSSDVQLMPVFPENAPDILIYARDEAVRRMSTFFPPIFNLTDVKSDALENILKNNKNTYCLFRIESKEKIHPSPYIGLYDIDRNQGRGFIIYLCTDTDLRQKRLYEPLKLLCDRAFSEWRIDRLYVLVESNDKASITMLKGFGFMESILAEGYSQWKGEPIDVRILSCNKNNFRTFNP
ncbi:MAG: GNAT family N-acetyltransferase [Leptospirales bacterium]|nr:GNAT family N-acetyltransferase [Leptospirales bacterium]